MRKKTALILSVACLFLFQATPSASQFGAETYTDSLQIRLATAETDEAKARILFQLSDYWSERDSTLALNFIRQSFPYTEENSYLRGLAYFYRAGAYYSYDRNKSQADYLSADSLLQNYTSAEAYLYRSRLWHNYGALEQQKGNSNGFVDLILTKALPFAEEAGDRERVAWNYMDLGAVFMNYKNYTRAEEYYSIATGILNKSAKNSSVLADCYLNSAKSRLLQNRTDSVTSYLESAFGIISTNNDSIYLPFYYYVEGMYYGRSRQWEKGVRSLETGITLARQFNRKYDEVSILYELYSLHKQQGLTGAAKGYLQQALHIHQQYPVTNDRRMLLFELAETESSLGYYEEAFNYMLEFASVSDSLYAQQTAATIADMEARYRMAEKEKTLLKLQNRHQIQKLLLYFAIILLFLSGLFILYAYKQRKKKEAERLNRLRNELQMQVARAQLEGEEKERRRVARDLHDGLGGLLAGVKLNLSAVRHEERDGQDKALEEVMAQVDNSVRELRRIARNMVPEALVSTDFPTALQELCRTMSSPSMAVQCKLINVEEAISSRDKMEIYRIVQELLTNAVKHSGATEVFLQCSRLGDRFYITTEDNGIGFSKDLLMKETNGIGLRNIRSRVTLMQGVMEVDTAPQKGTIINIEMNVTGEK